MKYFFEIQILLLCFVLFGCKHDTIKESKQLKSISDTSIGEWRKYHSPVKSNLQNIYFDNTRKKGIITSNFILEFNDTAWVYSGKSFNNVSQFEAVIKNEKDIWAWHSDRINNSQLFHYNGFEWKQIKSPLAATINFLEIDNNGKIWLAGDREIVVFEKNQWLQVEYPPTPQPIYKLKADTGKSFWALSAGGELYYYNSIKYVLPLKDKKVKTFYCLNNDICFAVTDSVIYKISNLKASIVAVLPDLNKTLKIEVKSEKQIYVSGESGFFAKFDGISWIKYPMPATESLLDFALDDAGKGWIVGSNGTILTNMNYNSVCDNNDGGFSRRKIFSIGEDVDDEYGVAIGDFNSDGLNDIYAVCLYNNNRLYLNKGGTNNLQNGTDALTSIFTEEGRKRNVTGKSGDHTYSNLNISLGVGSADFDNNGTQDLYLCNLAGPNRLLLNDGTGYFRTVTGNKRAPLETDRSNAAILADVDNDGDLDMFITNEYSSNRLFLNNGAGYFEDVTESSGLASISGGMGASFADIDSDGKVDLCVANWGASNRVYKNITISPKNVKFEDITEKSGISLNKNKKSNAVVFADIDNNNTLDLFITARFAPNELYLNDGNGRFTNADYMLPNKDTLFTYGAVIADFDHDGFQDIFISALGATKFYKNFKGKLFKDYTAEYGAELNGYATGCSYGDLDNDGDLDIYAANYIGGSSAIFVNQINNQNFISIDIEGTVSNRDAIGAKVRIYKAGTAVNSNFLVGFREVNGGSGYCSVNSKTTHFGVEPGRYDVEVYFPASKIQKIISNVSNGSRVKIIEEEGFYAFSTNLSKSSAVIFTDSETSLEIFKAGIILLFIVISYFRGRARYEIYQNYLYYLELFTVLNYAIQIYFFLYKDIFVSFLQPFGSTITILVVGHLIIEKIVLERFHQKERTRIRNRIASDLHDDLASTLGSAVIYNDALIKNYDSYNTCNPDLLKKLKTVLSDASVSIADIVWSITPQKDSLNDLLIRLRILLSDYCYENSIKLTIDFPSLTAPIALTNEVKRNIYLIFKESINNIVKHSTANEVAFSVKKTNNSLIIILQDNGKGFREELHINSEETTQKPDTIGHGLQNMHSRAKEINAILTIDSIPNTSTNVALSIKMT